MELDLGWILLGLPVAFALGWAASRIDLRQMRIDNRRSPKAYFQGLNHLLNEQQDKAIDAFIEAVQKDPDTSELHFALGNLFRRRGEFERAVRVHQHLLSRADLSRAERDRAQHALAQDYLKAGLLDRAEEALVKLDGTVHETQAQLALLAIYERSRDWAKATAIAGKLERAGQGSFSSRLAHYLCEQAEQELAPILRNPAEQATSETPSAQVEASARALLHQALEHSPAAPRASLLLAELDMRCGQANAACARLFELARSAPQALPLACTSLIRAARLAGQIDQTIELLRGHYEASPSLDVLQSLAELIPGQARDWYAHHLQKEPSLVAAARWLQGERLEQEQLHPLVQRALEQAARPLLRYRCAACGFEAKRHFWHCPGCQAWDSYPFRRVEEL